MSWGVLPWVYPVWDFLGFLDLGDYFLPHFGEACNYYLMVFLFVFFFWDSYDSNVGVFNIVPEFSEVVLISFNSFFFSSLLHLFLQFYLPAHQAPPSLGFSRQEHWSGLPFPSPVHESEK